MDSFEVFLYEEKKRIISWSGKSRVHRNRGKHR